MSGCSSGPAEAPGHPIPQLPGRLAYFSQLHGASDSPQGLSPSPPLRAWPPAEWSEERAQSSPADHFLGGLSGLNLDAGPSGPCSGREHSVVLGLLQARSTLCLLKVSGACFRALLVWRDPSFLLSGVRRQMITTDASLSGWGDVFEGRPAYGVWSGKYLAWHINGLDLRVVYTALSHFLLFLTHLYVIVRTDNMAVVSQINRQGGSQSCTLNSMGAAEVDLFASQESTQCPLWLSLSHTAFLGINALAHPWPYMKLYAFPPVKLIPAVLRRVKTCRLRLLLVVPF